MFYVWCILDVVQRDFYVTFSGHQRTVPSNS